MYTPAAAGSIPGHGPALESRPIDRIPTTTRQLTQRRQAIRIGPPIAILLVLLAAVTAGLMWFAVVGQDRVAREASETITGSAFDAEREALERTVRDYSSWNEAVTNLIFDFDASWATGNIAQWLDENFSIGRMFVFDPGQSPLYATLDGEPVADDAPAWRVSDLRDLVEQVRARANDPSVSASAYVEFADGVYLVAASKLLLETGAAGFPAYPDKGVLILARRIDAGLLEQIKGDLQLPDLALRAGPPTADDRASLSLVAPDGIPVARITWTPPRPGRRLLTRFALPLGGAFVLSATLIGLIVVRARRASQALLAALEAQEAAQAELEHMARHDTLTGLPNRALFLDHLGTAIAQSARNGNRFAVHYLDLDGFKQVNDTYGHGAGDTLLETTATRLLSSVRAADTVARFGGDEFAILQRDCAGETDATVLAQRITRAIKEPFEVDGHAARVSVSVGIAFSDAGVDAEELLARADRALYQAKHAGGNGFCLDDNRTGASGTGVSTD